ncbi:acyltransferase family protein [Butyrivibrio sp. AE3004]|uniref:acyltransferase family protein n=1 Tax=Butyrivibrio sp. AE3004 TaxID=1506994 RepID=UPI0009DD1538|nr:acyltransferase [Butyrivibrio sp. AE3004]
MTNEKGNSFGILRYYAAFCVMYLHFTGYMMSLVPDHVRGIGVLRSIVNFYQPTVIMFAISGFLISASLERGGMDAKTFVKKRFSRLYPDLWLSMAVYIAALYLIIRDKFDSSILKWCFTQGIGIAGTPSCLKDFATGSINGPMWYFTVLIQLYILVFLFKLITKNSRSSVLYGITCAVLAVCNIICSMSVSKIGDTGAKLLERFFLPYAVWFFMGVFIQTCKLHEIKNIKTISLITVIIHAVIRISGTYDIGYYTGVITGICTCILTIAAAHLLTCTKIKTDLSYGMYLYHWLFLNLIIHYQLYDKFHWMVCLIIFTLSTIVFAYIFRVKRK